MAEKKKYYWLKLKRDFFKRHDVRVIEGMENGKDYVLFYLKLLVESIDHDGGLRFSDTIPYDETMLSTITNTNIDTVRCAMKIFHNFNLIDILDDQTIYMNQITEMTGSETKWAEKKRLYREEEDIRRTLGGHDEDNVLSDGGQNETMSDKSKSIEIDIKSKINTEPEPEIINLPVLSEIEQKGSKPPAKKGEQFDDLEIHILQIIIAVQPKSTWSNKGKEIGQIKILAKSIRDLFKDGVPFDDTFQLSDAILATFLEMREFGHWRAKDKPVIPSSVSTAWAEIITQLAEGYRTVESVGSSEEIIF